MKPSTRILLMQKRLLTPIFLGSRLALWLDTADSRTITLDGSTASQWRDKSGNGRHASQGVKANQPTYTANGFNGKPMLTFDGVNDSLVIATAPIFSSGNANLSAFFVYSPKSADGSIFANYPQGQFQFAYSSGRVGYLTPWGVWNNAQLNLATGSFVQNQGLIAGAIRNSGVFTGYTNGNTDLSAANNLSVYGGSDTQSQWFIAANSVGSELGNIDLTEIVLLNSALSTIELQQLTGYFAHKWSLTANLPNDHSFKFRPPYM